MVFWAESTTEDYIMAIYNQNMTFWYIILTADPFANKVDLMAHHHKVDCLVKRSDCSVMVMVTYTGRVQNSNEGFSGQYLFNCRTFCNQTWYGDATLWAKVLCKKVGLLSSSSGSHWGLIYSNMTVSTISAELIFLQPNLVGWYIIISWSVLCKNSWFSKSRSQCRYKTLLNLYVSYIFCTTDLLATKEGVLIFYS